MSAHVQVGQTWEVGDLVILVVGRALRDELTWGKTWRCVILTSACSKVTRISDRSLRSGKLLAALSSASG